MGISLKLNENACGGGGEVLSPTFRYTGADMPGVGRKLDLARNGKIMKPEKFKKVENVILLIAYESDTGNGRKEGL